jgi:acyl dehydratase
MRSRRSRPEIGPRFFCLDDKAASRSFFGSFTARGCHTAASTMRRLVEGECMPAGGIVGAGGALS